MMYTFCATLLRRYQLWMLPRMGCVLPTQSVPVDGSQTGQHLSRAPDPTPEVTVVVIPDPPIHTICVVLGFETAKFAIPTAVFVTPHRLAIDAATVGASTTQVPGTVIGPAWNVCAPESPGDRRTSKANSENNNALRRNSMGETSSR
jgi:hypothetical protein